MSLDAIRTVTTFGVSVRVLFVAFRHTYLLCPYSFEHMHYVDAFLSDAFLYAFLTETSLLASFQTHLSDALLADTCLDAFLVDMLLDAFL
jgi:hypothetical protein